MIELISKFCNKQKAGLAKPFSQGEYTYVTDGRIAIRVPRLEGVDESETAPDMTGKLIWDHDEINTWDEAPEVDIDQNKSCRQCGGSGKMETCPECDGYGELSFENAYSCYDFDCKTCCGEGIVAGGEEGDICGDCLGLGLDAKVPIKWGEGFISALYVSRLKELLGLKISKHGDGLEPWRFKFDGGCGLVMPMRG